MTDSRYALRSLMRAPTYTIAAIASLALGSGIIAAVGSVVVASLRPLPPVAGIERLIVIKPTHTGRLLIGSALSEDDLDDLRRARLRSIGPPAGFGFFQAALRGGGRSTIIKGEAVFGDYFSLLGADPRVVGSPAQLGGRLFTIVGVVPATFRGLHAGHLLGNDVWAPRSAVKRFLPGTHVSAHTFARLTTGHTRAQADGSLRAVRPRTETSTQRTLAAIPFEQQFATSPVALLSAGSVVLGLSVLVLGACCGNLTSLILARVVTRQGELATRLMLGAGPRELLRLLTLEVAIIVGTFGYAVRDGSMFTDRASGDDIVVNEAAASRWWPGERAVGQQVLLTVGGVATRVRVAGVVSEPSSLNGIGPVILQPLSSRPTPSRVVLAVSSADGVAPVAAMVGVAKRVSSTMAPYDVRTLRQELTGSSTHLEAGAGVAGVLAFVACVISLTGLYGTVAHLSGRRRREFAVRMACGATATEIYRLIAREQGVLIVIGIGAGALAAGAVAHILAGYFNGLPLFDWRASIAAPLVLAGLCMMAALAPMRPSLGTGAFVSLRN